MIEFNGPSVESLRATPRDEGKRRFVFVTMPDADPFELIGLMAVCAKRTSFSKCPVDPTWCTTTRSSATSPEPLFEAEGLRIVVDKPCYDI